MNRPRRGYKRVKWLFKKEIEIPEGWKLERLGNICKIRKGNNISSDLYIGLEHIGRGNNLIESTGNANEFTSTKNTFIQDDVLYGKLRPLLNKVWLATESGYCSTDILPLTPTSKILSQILLFVLTNHDFLWYAVGTSAGTKMPRTSWSDMKKFPVVLPNIQEQQKIASILSGVDALIESTQKTIEKTERLKKGLMQKLLTRGIGHTEFKKVKWLFGKKIEIPENWSYEKLSQFCEKEGDIVAGPFGSNLIVNDYRKQGIPIIRLQNIKRNQFIEKNLQFIDKKKAKELQYHSYKPSDLVLAKLGDPIGKTCRIPANFSLGIVVADVVRIRPSKQKTDYRFMEYALNSDLCKKQLNKEKIGTTRPRVNLKQVRNLQLPLSPLPEQTKIASILSGVDAYVKKNQDCKKKMERLKKGLMQKLLSGQIRVKDH